MCGLIQMKVVSNRVSELNYLPFRGRVSQNNKDFWYCFGAMGNYFFIVHLTYFCLGWPFFKIFWTPWVLFCGATYTPVLDLWWHLPWISKPGWIPCMCALSLVYNEFLRFISGATPDNLMTASMAADYIPYMHVGEVGFWDLVGRPPAQ